MDTYQYNSLNQMVHKQECGYVQKITRIHNFGYAYDKRGNLTSQWEICSPTTQGPKNITVATYVYDETNRMVQGTNKDGEVSLYTYNGLGIRVGTEQIVKDNTHGYTDFHCETPSVETGIDKPEVVKTDYMIDYTRIGVDQRLLWKSEEGGYDYRYVYGIDALSVKVTGEGTNWWGQKIHQNVAKEYYHVDVRGSLVNMTDGFGRVAMRADYDDWGDLTHSDSITVNGGFRQLYLLDNYTGHEYDQVLELYYAKYRFYDPAERRFVAEDPVAGNILQPLSMVPYTYCQDKPLVAIDPLGCSMASKTLSHLASQLFRYGVSSSQGQNIFLTIVQACINVPRYTLHSIAQVLTGYYIVSHHPTAHVEFEKAISSPYDSGNVDIFVKASSRTQTINYVFEVKRNDAGEIQRGRTQIRRYNSILTCMQVSFSDPNNFMPIGVFARETIFSTANYDAIMTLKHLGNGLITYQVDTQHKRGGQNKSNVTSEAFSKMVISSGALSRLKTEQETSVSKELDQITAKLYGKPLSQMTNAEAFEAGFKTGVVVGTTLVLTFSLVSIAATELGIGITGVVGSTYTAPAGYTTSGVVVKIVPKTVETIANFAIAA